MQELNLKLINGVGGGFSLAQIETGVKHLQKAIDTAEVSGGYVAAAVAVAAASGFVASKFFYNAEAGDEPISKLGWRLLQVGAVFAAPALFIYKGLHLSKPKKHHKSA